MAVRERYRTASSYVDNGRVIWQFRNQIGEVRTETAFLTAFDRRNNYFRFEMWSLDEEPAERMTVIAQQDTIQLWTSTDGVVQKNFASLHHAILAGTHNPNIHDVLQLAPSLLREDLAADLRVKWSCRDQPRASVSVAADGLKIDNVFTSSEQCWQVLVAPGGWEIRGAQKAFDVPELDYSGRLAVTIDGRIDEPLPEGLRELPISETALPLLRRAQ
jgi:hypothetical protein